MYSTQNEKLDNFQESFRISRIPDSNAHESPHSTFLIHGINQSQSSPCIEKTFDNHKTNTKTFHWETKSRTRKFLGKKSFCIDALLSETPHQTHLESGKFSNK